MVAFSHLENNAKFLIAGYKTCWCLGLRFQWRPFFILVLSLGWWLNSEKRFWSPTLLWCLLVWMFACLEFHSEIIDVVFLNFVHWAIIFTTSYFSKKYPLFNLPQIFINLSFLDKNLVDSRKICYFNGLALILHIFVGPKPMFKILSGKKYA